MSDRQIIIDKNIAMPTNEIEQAEYDSHSNPESTPVNNVYSK